MRVYNGKSKFNVRNPKRIKFWINHIDNVRGYTQLYDVRYVR